MKAFKGKVLFLDRSDINTDEIIPAKYLTENEKEALRPHLLEDLVLEGFDPSKDLKENRVIVTRENFGCGSSREHAPWALEENGFNVVIAASFARIFRQNMFNCGMLAIELEDDKLDKLFKEFKNAKAHVEIDVDQSVIKIHSLGDSQATPSEFSFNISQFDRALIKTGGWIGYADTNY